MIDMENLARIFASNLLGLPTDEKQIQDI